MPKNFKHKQVKEEVQYHKKLLNNLHNGASAFKAFYYYIDLKQQLNNLLDLDYFSELVENGIKGNAIDIDEQNLKLFISNIYYYKEISKYSITCKSLYDSNNTLVESNILALSSASSPFSWFFSSKKRKQELKMHIIHL